MAKSSSTDLFFFGTSGLVLPFNKSQYPTEFKDKSRLQYYASLFNSIEFNNTFYKLPQPATVNNWAESVPDDFKFTFKVPKSITHSQDLESGLCDVANFLSVVENAGHKKGSLLAQFPPSLTIEQIEPFKKLLHLFVEESKGSLWKLAVEFRHPSWQEPQVYQLLQDFKASLVLHDMKNSPLQIPSVDDDFIYLRLHGPEPRYRGSYSDEFLKQLAESIGEWIDEGRTVYAYFNNTVGDAFNNVQTLKNYVKLFI